MSIQPTKIQQQQSEILAGEAKFLLFYGGAGSGKTFGIIDELVWIAIQYPNARIAIIRKFFSELIRSVWVETIPSVIQANGLERICKFYGGHSVRFWNGSELVLMGVQDKQALEKVLGQEYCMIYMNEISSLSFDAYEIIKPRLRQVVLDSATGNRLYGKIILDCNPPSKRHWSYDIFFNGINPVSKNKLHLARYAKLQMNPSENLVNLPQDYLDDLGELSERKKQRFLYGEYQEDNDNALWNRDIIDQYRVSECPANLRKIVVGVDPAVTARESSDATGIIVCGVKESSDGKDHYYVLEDYTMQKAHPYEWAEQVATAYHKHHATLIVVETNNGGDLVKDNIEAYQQRDTQRRFLPVQGVHAKYGKLTRAEPIATLYQNGYVHHVGNFPALEDEMCSYCGLDQEESPDRMDAMVWALTALGGYVEAEMGKVNYFV
jgi:PBSX family phage terminase large subunit